MTLALRRELAPELRAEQARLNEIARGYGLDTFETVFETVSWDELCAVAAQTGFPSRYPHWRFGMEYEQLAKGYEYGLSKIYELVINNNPCYAYLLDSNSLLEQKLVIAHVFGHCDFFKNNRWFAATNRKMMDEAANHGHRIRALMERHGETEVEDFIDRCLSLEDLVDPYAPYAAPPPPAAAAEDDAKAPAEAARFDAKPYLDAFVNPPARLAAEAQAAEELAARRERRFPESPERDVLGFLLKHAPLKNWQRDVLAIVRDEALYFAPQGMTKVMNEGWASYWHSTIMTERGLGDAEILDFADRHAGTMAMEPGQFNPYKVGLELFRDIEQRWNTGRHGKDYEDCPDAARKAAWDTKAGAGRAKIFEVRRTHNDATFIDAFLTEDFCRRHRLFSFAYSKRNRRYEIESREFAEIKERLLFQLTNHGRPFLAVVDGNFRNRGELLLRHRWLGVELKLAAARDTLANLAALWGRPVHVETVLEGKAVLLGFDGTRHEISPMEGKEVAHED